MSAGGKRILYVGLDVGGTSMKAGVVTDAGEPLSEACSVVTEPHKGQDFGLQCMGDAIEKAMQAAGVSLDEITAIGVATPGLMDIPGGVILDPPNLKPWKNVPVREYVANRFQKPTAFQNDANAAAYGEFWVGAGQSAQSMVLFTLGTGVGGGIILGDTIVEGRHSHGAELGHMIIEMSKPRTCGCGRSGCLEAYASATAVVKRAREALEPVDVSSSLKDILKNGQELTSRAIFDAAAAGDDLAEKIVDDTAYYLAVGSTNMMHIINPDMVVLGGGMSAAGDRFLDRIRNYVNRLAFEVPARGTTIRFAALGSDAGFIGAAGCARLMMKKQAGS